MAQAIATDDAPLTTLAAHPHGGLFTSADLVEARRLLGEDGNGVVFIVGRPNIAESAAPVEAAIRQFAERYPKAKFLPTLRRSNVNGALDMGLTPNLAPGQHFSPTQGRSTIEQLRAAATGEQTVIVSLGGDIIENVVDTPLANAALTKAALICVTGHGGPSLAHAAVVLPTTVMHERLGTVTNIEGRVSLLAPKVTPPGSTWPDVAIAAELAEEFGQNIGLANPEETATIIEATTGYPAATAMRSSLEGVVVGRDDVQVVRRPLDPMAFPGVRSADMVGLAPRAGAVTATPTQSTGAITRPTLGDVAGEKNPAIPMPDAYSLRLVVDRTIYDNGAAVRGAEALQALVPTSALRVNAHDLTRIGVESGGAVRLTSARGSEIIAVRADTSIPRGCVALHFGTLATTNPNDSANVVNWVVDVNQVVIEVRMESL